MTLIRKTDGQTRMWPEDKGHTLCNVILLGNDAEMKKADGDLSNVIDYGVEKCKECAVVVGKVENDDQKGQKWLTGGQRLSKHVKKWWIMPQNPHLLSTVSSKTSYKRFLTFSFSNVMPACILYRSVFADRTRYATLLRPSVYMSVVRTECIVAKRCVIEQ